MVIIIIIIINIIIIIADLDPDPDRFSAISFRVYFCIFVFFFVQISLFSIMEREVKFFVIISKTYIGRKLIFVL